MARANERRRMPGETEDVAISRLPEADTKWKRRAKIRHSRCAAFLAFVKDREFGASPEDDFTTFGLSLLQLTQKVVVPLLIPRALIFF